MACYAGKEDHKEIYEGFEIDDYIMTLHGFEEPTEFGDDSVYFHVTKAIAEMGINNKTYYAELSEEFLKDLNDFKQDYYKLIIDQIKEE